MPGATPFFWVQIFYFDDLFLRAAQDRRFISVEHVVPTKDLSMKRAPKLRLRISRLLVDGSSSEPRGAHFTSCVPGYERDEVVQHRYGNVPKTEVPGHDFKLTGWSADETNTTQDKSIVSDVTRAEVCVVAIADCLVGDGEIVANPIGIIPMIGGRLARATCEPDLVMTDGEATFSETDHEAFIAPEDRIIESYNPYRSMFDVVWSGRRHVIMGASQIDRYGNQTWLLSVFDYARPKSQLIGFRGAPGNTVNHVTSYWIPNHSAKSSSSKLMS